MEDFEDWLREHIEHVESISIDCDALDNYLEGLRDCWRNFIYYKMPNISRSTFACCALHAGSDEECK